MLERPPRQVPTSGSLVANGVPGEPKAGGTKRLIYSTNASIEPTFHSQYLDQLGNMLSQISLNLGKLPI